MMHILEPFEDWSDGKEQFFGICVKDGVRFYPDPHVEYEMDEYHEWTIGKYGDHYVISVSHDEVMVSEVYIGKIPTRDFFITLMNNVIEGFDIMKVGGIIQNKDETSNL